VFVLSQAQHIAVALLAPEALQTEQFVIAALQVTHVVLVVPTIYAKVELLHCVQTVSGVPQAEQPVLM
jgi:hypothetical protein